MAEVSNKRLGIEFEKEFVKMLARQGFWAHFLEPNKSGAQPFDIIAVKDGKAWAFDCKTSVKKLFSISRLEVNQMYAFNKLAYCGCRNTYAAVLHNDEVYLVSYEELCKHGSVELNENHLFQQIIH